MQNYDAIIIGAGHNGLVAAAYLAKVKKKVLVLERRSIVGGSVDTGNLQTASKRILYGWVEPCARTLSSI